MFSVGEIRLVTTATRAAGLIPAVATSAHPAGCWLPEMLLGTRGAGYVDLGPPRCTPRMLRRTDNPTHYLPKLTSEQGLFPIVEQRAGKSPDAVFLGGYRRTSK